MIIKKDQLYFIDRTHFYQLDLNTNKCKKLLKVGAYIFDVNEKYSVFSQMENLEIYTSKHKKIITLDKLRLVNGNIDGFSLYKNRLFINTCSKNLRQVLLNTDIYMLRKCK